MIILKYGLLSTTVDNADNGVTNYLWHGKPVIVPPVKSNWSFDISQVIVWHRAIVVLEIELVTAPVIAMESS
jgi:hypothetical protein